MKEYFNKLYKGSKNDFYDLVKKNLISNKRMFVVTANPETLMTAENNSNFRNALLDSNTTIIADGIGIIKGAKMLGYSLPGTIPGVELCSELFKYCNDLNKSIFLFGAKEEIVKKLVDTIKQKYPNAIITGYENGYKKDRQAVFTRIKTLEPDINDFDKGIFIGVGGSFDVLSGVKKRAPKIFIKLHLEWLYRIIREPKRFKRFFNSNVKYIFKIRKARIN